jgi:hypothetical protein
LTPLHFGVSRRNLKPHGSCFFQNFHATNSNFHNADRYYAAPTIHHAILTSKPDLTGDLHIRMICNAAGGLLPSLAVDLKKTFAGAVVLPSYGMTE